MKPKYLTDPSYLRELAPSHAIVALEEVEGDEETKQLCRELARAMLRLRDKAQGRPVRPKLEG